MEKNIIAIAKKYSGILASAGLCLSSQCSEGSVNNCVKTEGVKISGVKTKSQYKRYYPGTKIEKTSILDRIIEMSAKISKRRILVNKNEPLSKESIKKIKNIMVEQKRLYPYDSDLKEILKLIKSRLNLMPIELWNLKNFSEFYLKLTKNISYDQNNNGNEGLVDNNYALPHPICIFDLYTQLSSAGRKKIQRFFFEFEKEIKEIRLSQPKNEESYVCFGLICTDDGKKVEINNNKVQIWADIHNPLTLPSFLQCLLINDIIDIVGLELDYNSRSGTNCLEFIEMLTRYDLKALKYLKIYGLKDVLHIQEVIRKVGKSRGNFELEFVDVFWDRMPQDISDVINRYSKLFIKE